MPAPSRCHVPKKTAPADEPTRADVAEPPRTGRAWPPAWDSQPLVFLEETATDTGWPRCPASVPHGPGKTTILIGTLRREGLTVLLMSNGALHGAAFLAGIQSVLAPTLRPGDMVVMDNLSVHQVAVPLRLPGLVRWRRACFFGTAYVLACLLQII